MGPPGQPPVARAPQPLFWVFGRGEALLAGMAALAAGSGLAHPAPALGALLVAEGGWQALRWLALEAPWEQAPTRPAAATPRGLSLPYLQPGSLADRGLREGQALYAWLRACARWAPDRIGALVTALLALGVGILLVGPIGGVLTLGAGAALGLARRIPRPMVRALLEGLALGTFPWWLGIAVGLPTPSAFLAGLPLGLAWAGFQCPVLRGPAWAAWVAWAVALGHGPGAYGLALIGLALMEERLARRLPAQTLLWIVALGLTVWIVRSSP